VPFGTPVILVADTKLVHEYAVRQLLRIGYDQLPGYLDGGMDAWINAGLPVEQAIKLTMRELRKRLDRGDPLVVLDVRQAHEWDVGHMPNAILHEAGDVRKGVPTLPRDGLVAAHCGHGERAATALSLLEQRGYTDLALVTGGMDEWRAAGGEIVRGQVSQTDEAISA
jgi:hydroxyacylglutathione hydrolase